MQQSSGPPVPECYEILQADVFSYVDFKYALIFELLVIDQKLHSVI